VSAGVAKEAVAAIDTFYRQGGHEGTKVVLAFVAFHFEHEK
jgi:hypothetical protein